MAKQKGIWVQLPSGVKEIIDMVCSMQNISRKAYCQTIIEKDIVDYLSGITGIESMFDSFNPRLTTAYQNMLARRNGETVEEDVEDEEGYDGVDLPVEITGSS